jgi:hypothetical protein
VSTAEAGRHPARSEIVITGLMLRQRDRNGAIVSEKTAKNALANVLRVSLNIPQ